MLALDRDLISNEDTIFVKDPQWSLKYLILLIIKLIQLNIGFLENTQ